MASLLALSVVDAPGCVPVAAAVGSRQARRSTLSSVSLTRSSSIGAAARSDFVGSAEASAQLSAAAAAPCRRIRLSSAGNAPSRMPGVRAGLGDYAVTTAAVYGVTLLIGGLFAYVRTGSKGSLGGGLTGAVLFGTTYYLLQTASTQSLGNAVGFGTGLLFSAVFGKPVPAGPLLAISALATAVFASAYFG